MATPENEELNQIYEERNKIEQQYQSVVSKLTFGYKKVIDEQQALAEHAKTLRIAQRSIANAMMAEVAQLRQYINGEGKQRPLRARTIAGLQQEQIRQERAYTEQLKRAIGLIEDRVEAEEEAIRMNKKFDDAKLAESKRKYLQILDRSGRELERSLGIGPVFSTIGRAVGDFKEMQSAGQKTALAFTVVAEVLSSLQDTLDVTQRKIGTTRGTAFEQMVGAQTEAIRSIFKSGAKVSSEEIIDATVAFTKEFGTILSPDAARGIAQEAKAIGVTADIFVKARRQFLTVGEASKTQALYTSAFVNAGLKQSSAFQFAAQNANLVAVAGEKYATSLGRAGASAARIGVSLQKTTSYFDGILDNFEGSLEQAAELRAMGVDIEFNEMARIAATGTPEEQQEALVDLFKRNRSLLENLQRQGLIRRQIQTSFPQFDFDEIIRMARGEPAIRPKEETVKEKSQKELQNTFVKSADTATALVNYIMSFFNGMAINTALIRQNTISTLQNTAAVFKFRSINGLGTTILQDPTKRPTDRKPTTGSKPMGSGVKLAIGTMLAGLAVPYVANKIFGGGTEEQLDDFTSLPQSNGPINPNRPYRLPEHTIVGPDMLEKVGKKMGSTRRDIRVRLNNIQRNNPDAELLNKTIDSYRRFDVKVLGPLTPRSAQVAQDIYETNLINFRPRPLMNRLSQISGGGMPNIPKNSIANRINMYQPGNEFRELGVAHYNPFGDQMQINQRPYSKLEENTTVHEFMHRRSFRTRAGFAEMMLNPIFQNPELGDYADLNKKEGYAVAGESAFNFLKYYETPKPNGMPHFSGPIARRNNVEMFTRRILREKPAVQQIIFDLLQEEAYKDHPLTPIRGAILRNIASTHRQRVETETVTNTSNIIALRNNLRMLLKGNQPRSQLNDFTALPQKPQSKQPQQPITVRKPLPIWRQRFETLEVYQIVSGRRGEKALRAYADTAQFTDEEAAAVHRENIKNLTYPRGLIDTLTNISHPEGKPVTPVDMNVNINRRVISQYNEATGKTEYLRPSTFSFYRPTSDQMSIKYPESRIHEYMHRRDFNTPTGTIITDLPIYSPAYTGTLPGIDPYVTTNKHEAYADAGAKAFKILQTFTKFPLDSKAITTENVGRFMDGFTDDAQIMRNKSIPGMLSVEQAQKKGINYPGGILVPGVGPAMLDLLYDPQFKNHPFQPMRELMAQELIRRKQITKKTLMQLENPDISPDSALFKFYDFDFRGEFGSGGTKRIQPPKVVKDIALPPVAGNLTTPRNKRLEQRQIEIPDVEINNLEDKFNRLFGALNNMKINMDGDVVGKVLFNIPRTIQQNITSATR